MAATPGRALPSSSSRLAPPPVDRWSTWSARPSLGQGGGRVALADHGVAVGGGDQFGETVLVPAANGASSNTPMGLVPEHGAGVGDGDGERQALAGPMSRPFQPGSIPSAGTVRASMSSLTSPRPRRWAAAPACPCCWPSPAAAARRRPGRARTGSRRSRGPGRPGAKHMPPPTTRLSTRPRRLSSTSSLSDTLLPSSTAVNGRSGSSSSRDSTLTSPASRSPA